LVTSCVAGGVVDSLEAVEVDRDGTEVELGARTSGQFPVQVALEGSPVGTPGQWVTEGSPLDLVSGSATGVDHREVDQPRDRPVSRSARDQCSELDELLDNENRQSNSRSPPCRCGGKSSSALDMD